ncbi:MAG: hypothetical protein KKC46_20515 [Proteobacteria bacterium]|nr:hypothetical protein [Pseudomonadota bacterium]
MLLHCCDQTFPLTRRVIAAPWWKVIRIGGCSAACFCLKEQKIGFCERALLILLIKGLGETVIFIKYSYFIN